MTAPASGRSGWVIRAGVGDDGNHHVVGVELEPVGCVGGDDDHDHGEDGQREAAGERDGKDRPRREGGRPRERAQPPRAETDDREDGGCERDGSDGVADEGVVI